MSERWISFDCFGTLVDWHGGFRAILTAAGVVRTQDLIDAYHRHERVVESQPYRPYREVTEIALRRAMQEEAMGPGVPCSIIAERWSTLPVFADTVCALEQLRADGWSLAILTNCDDDLFAETAAKLGVTFDRVITAQHVRSYKPALGHFRFFKETIGDAPWIHAACSWFHDIVPARAVGIPRVWVDRDRTGDEPAIATRVIPDLTELPSIVRQLIR